MTDDQKFCVICINQNVKPLDKQTVTCSGIVQEWQAAEKMRQILQKDSKELFFSVARVGELCTFEGVLFKVQLDGSVQFFESRLGQNE